MCASNWQQILSVSVQGGRVIEVMACYDNASMASEWRESFQMKYVTGLSFSFNGLFGFNVKMSEYLPPTVLTCISKN